MYRSPLFFTTTPSHCCHTHAQHVLDALYARPISPEGRSARSVFLSGLLQWRVILDLTLTSASLAPCSPRPRPPSLLGPDLDLERERRRRPQFAPSLSFFPTAQRSGDPLPRRINRLRIRIGLLSLDRGRRVYRWTVLAAIVLQIVALPWAGLNNRHDSPLDRDIVQASLVASRTSTKPRVRRAICCFSFRPRRSDMSVTPSSRQAAAGVRRFTVYCDRSI